MKIDKKLNLVVPIEVETGTIYVHSAPVSRACYEAYFLVISKTFSAIYSEGLGVTSGPRVASMMLRKIASDMGMWDGPEGVANGLMNEIRRMTNVVVPTSTGWQSIMLDEAVTKGLLDEDDMLEVEGQLVFFTCSYHTHTKAQRLPMLESASGLWGTLITSLNATEYSKSLPTSTETASSGEKVTQSSIAV